MINQFDPENSQVNDAELQLLIDRRSAVLGPSYKLFYDDPLHFVRGEGVRLYDQDGTAYLDAYNNVPCVGHCHPAVVSAVSEQAAKLNTHTRYLSEIIVAYAEKLTATFPDPLSLAMFTCTGSEANDLALRIARQKTGNDGVIVTENGYHGITAAIAEISPSLGAGVPLGAHVRRVKAPDRLRAGPDGVAAEFTASVKRAITDLERHGIKPAAIIFDTIFSSDGVLSHPAGFIQGAVEAVQEAGGLFIADEVQAGFARTGDAMWGFERHGVIPDIVAMGKPMGNGMPIAGLVSSMHVLEEFGRTARYFNTFGGNPVSCAAALATLTVIEEEGLLENSRVVGKYLQAGLRDIAQSFDEIGEVRGAGLFVGVDIVSDPATKAYGDDFARALVNRLRELKVLIAASGKGGHALKIRPPLPFSKTHADEFLAAFKIAMRDVSVSNRRAP
ncbi:MAG: aspartate aminotransferase family protein [Pseudomonadota bacterium]